MQANYVPKPGHREVMSGLLTLVHDGVAQQELLPHTAYTCSQEHPRTLLGLTADKRKLIMVVVDGRAPQAGRRGMTCREAADFMVSLGAHWALNLDGGGSSEMVVGGRIVNVPSDGQERPVPTHLALVRPPGARGQCPVAPPPPPPPPVSKPACGKLPVDAHLLPGESVVSCNGRFTFIHRRDGNVVLSDRGTVRWQSRTVASSSTSLVMQSDGNLVLYGTGGAALWHSHTYGHPGAALSVQNDGNVTVRAPSGAVLWQTQTTVTPPPPLPAPKPVCGRLGSGSSLLPGKAVRSCDGRFVFVHQTDGNVVLYQGSRALWSTRTAGRASRLFAVQGDGNLVLYGAATAVFWNSRTQGHPGAALSLQDDGDVVLRSSTGLKLWSTQTGGR